MLSCVLEVPLGVTKNDIVRTRAQFILDSVPPVGAVAVEQLAPADHGCGGAVTSKPPLKKDSEWERGNASANGVRFNPEERHATNQLSI